jgi:hypothetical protein
MICSGERSDVDIYVGYGKPIHSHVSRHLSCRLKHAILSPTNAFLVGFILVEAIFDIEELKSIAGDLENWRINGEVEATRFCDIPKVDTTQ